MQCWNMRQTIVIGNKDPEFVNHLDRLQDGQSLVDFVRIVDDRRDRMSNIAASAGESRGLAKLRMRLPKQNLDSVELLSRWLEKNDYRGYDTFDGLNATFVRPLMFKQLAPHGAATGCASISNQSAPVVGRRKEPFQQGHGISGARLYAPI